MHHHSIQRCLQTVAKTHPCTEVRMGESKAVELQRAATRNDMTGFYSGMKEVWVPKMEGPVQLKSIDGMETFSGSKTVVST